MRSLFVPAVLFLSCVPLQHPNSSVTKDEEVSCAFDSQCPGGSCRTGVCSDLSPDAPACASDIDCNGGTCSFGTCSPFPPPPPPPVLE